MAPGVVTVNILVLAVELKSKVIVCKGFVVIVQTLTHVGLFESPQTAAHQAPLSFTVSLSLLKLMPTEPVMSSNCLTLCRPLLLSPSIFPRSSLFQ